MTTKFSTDDEFFRYNSAAEAIASMTSEWPVEPGRIYYSVETEIIDIADLFDADQLLESAECALDDLIGEAAEDAFSVSVQARAELEDAIKVWVGKHLSNSTYWRCVGSSTQHVVTDEDVRSINEAMK